MVILMVAKEVKVVKKAIAQKEELKKTVTKAESQKKPEVKATGKVLTPKKEVSKAVVKKELPKKAVTPKVEVKKEVANVESTGKVASAKTTKKVRKKKEAKKYLLVKSKRKTAIAIGKIESGHGRITVNKIPIDVVDNKHINYFLHEPLKLVESYKPELLGKVNILISVVGGGYMSQTIAARGCIAKGLVGFFEDQQLKELFMKYDKTLLIDDARRKEAKKQLGRGARAKKQRSKR